MKGVSPQEDVGGQGSRNRGTMEGVKKNYGGGGAVFNIGLAGRMPEEGDRLSSPLTEQRAPGRRLQVALKQ